VSRDKDAWASGWPKLDYAQAEFTPTEWRENMDFYGRIYGGWRPQDTLRLTPFNKLLRDHKPDMLKGWRRWAEATQSAAGAASLPGAATALVSLAHYILICYPEGIEYLMRTLQPLGVTKAEFLEAFAFAGLHGGPRALVVASPIVGPFLDEWDEAAPGATWPEGWTPDPEMMRSGLDFSTLELSEAEKAQLFDWHLRNEGETPKIVTFLAEHHPAGLKAFRERWEKAYQGVLPRQMPALFTLRIGIVTSQPAAVRRGVRHALVSGVTRAQIAQMIAMAQEWQGHAGLDMVVEAAEAALAT